MQSSAALLHNTLTFKNSTKCFALRIVPGIASLAMSSGSMGEEVVSFAARMVSIAPDSPVC